MAVSENTQAAICIIDETSVAANLASKAQGSFKQVPSYARASQRFSTDGFAVDPVFRLLLAASDEKGPAGFCRSWASSYLFREYEFSLQIFTASHTSLESGASVCQ